MNDPRTLPHLTEQRILAGLSQRQLAKRAGVSYQTIRRLEHGGDAGELTLRTVTRLLTALELRIESLLEGTGLPVTTGTTSTRLDIGEARLLKKLATKPRALSTLTKIERELVLPRLLRAEVIQVSDDTASLHTLVADTLLSSE